ncbi:MAG: type III pantothenate kinase [Candidatus Omnitrophica bacterium]|nr:type III pantothenate kinase [Candidatus Omnitrophota bacterium]
MRKNSNQLLLAIDIGNTSVLAGLFRGSQIIRRVRMPSTGNWTKFVKALLPFKKQLKAGIVSSVVPRLTPSLGKVLKNRLGLKVLVVGKDVIVPIRNRYSRPQQVGSDRLLNALAGYKMKGGPLVIADFGTALTFDVVNRRGDYLGGVIVPGLGIWLGALAEKTALLPRVSVPKQIGSLKLPGRSTVASILAGALFGYADICDGVVGRVQGLFSSKLKTMACGGLARICTTYCKTIRYIDVDLTLKGLMWTYRVYRSERGQRDN